MASSAELELELDSIVDAIEQRAPADNEISAINLSSLRLDERDEEPTAVAAAAPSAPRATHPHRSVWWRQRRAVNRALARRINEEVVTILVKGEWAPKPAHQTITNGSQPLTQAEAADVIRNADATGHPQLSDTSRHEHGLVDSVTGAPLFDHKVERKAWEALTDWLMLRWLKETETRAASPYAQGELLKDAAYFDLIFDFRKSPWSQQLNSAARGVLEAHRAMETVYLLTALDPKGHRGLVRDQVGPGDQVAVASKKRIETELIFRSVATDFAATDAGQKLRQDLLSTATTKPFLGYGLFIVDS